MNLRKKIFVLLQLLIFLASCNKFSLYEEFPGNSISIKNKSDSTIVALTLKTYECDSVDRRKTTTIRDIHCVYDTILHSSNDYSNHLIPPYEYRNRYYWEEEDIIDEDTATVFFISEYILNTCSWYRIVNEKMILARYDIPIKSYIANFDNIHPLTYPPTDEMSEIVVRYYNDKRDK